MRKIYVLLITALLAGSISGVAQVKHQKSKKSVKIDVFTPDEKDQIQFWFNEQRDSLKLNYKQKEEYTAVIVRNLNAVYHLTDSNKGYSVSEIKDKLNKIFDKIHAESKAIMDNGQYQEHLVNMERIHRVYENRLDNPSKETNLYNYLSEME